ncbi:ABC transporter ATP-binding protein [Pseudonocardia sp.]|uniref:ABC transporter ATP-binding protein n=1 Tax=Pseudonocardia sp. TaxID=60912 RepID=UPI003D121AB3
MRVGETLLDVVDLTVVFDGIGSPAQAVNGVSFTVRAGRSLGIVGESGSGKSVTAQAILRVLDSPPGRVEGGRVLFDGVDLLEVPERRMQAIRGRQIAIVFQDALTSLNPRLKVGYQLVEAARQADRELTKEAARERAVHLLERVQVPSARARMNAYPHELSGGMRQRVLIAMGLIGGPRLLIADEPTTALDVSVQAEIIDLLKSLTAEMGLSVILISHNLAVVANVVDELVVMYAGQVVESGPVSAVLQRPAHPYTKALLRSLPDLDRPKEVLHPIGGAVPNLHDLPSGCLFAPRCDFVEDLCVGERPLLREVGVGSARCHFSEQLAVSP